MEIKLDKSTLPKDGQRVRFLKDDWYEGCYTDGEDQIFTVGFSDGPTKDWFFAWQVSEWEPLDESVPDNQIDHEAEKEVMIQAFDKVFKMFQNRSWIMEGRGSYRYDDDRYKEEVRYLYDEFEALHKETFANIKSKSFEFRKKVIQEYVKDIVDELRKANPYEYQPMGDNEGFVGWNKCCYAIEQLLNQSRCP